MFEKLVLSSPGRRERRLSKFFVGSSLAYMLMAGSALAISIYVTDPKLTRSDTNINTIHFVAASGGSRHVDGPRNAAASRPNPYAVRRLDEMLQTPVAVRPPVLAANLPYDQFGTTPGGADSNSDGSGRFPGPGLGTSEGIGDAPRPVERSTKPPDARQSEKPQRAAPLRVSPGVLQGKAIDRKTPDYPQIAKVIHREGSVLVEVMISPEGRVESARAVSGDPLLAKSAVDAAYGWRFQPTYLGEVPVKVTGIITFVFKLGL